MAQYEALSPALAARIAQDRRDGTSPAFAFDDQKALRRHPSTHATIWRPPFVQDIDKISTAPITIGIPIRPRFFP